MADPIWTDPNATVLREDLTLIVVGLAIALVGLEAMVEMLPVLPEDFLILFWRRSALVGNG